MKNILLIIGLYLFSATNLCAQAYSGDKLVNILRNEAQFYLDKLKDREEPAYFISFRVVDEKQTFLSSEFGLSSSRTLHKRSLTPHVRVGNRQTDNYSKDYVFYNFSHSFDLPLDSDNEYAIKEAIWTGMKKQYKEGKEAYQKYMTSRKTNKSDLDTIPSFAQAPTEIYYEKPYSEKETAIDEIYFKKYLNDVSRIFKEYEELTTGNAALDYRIVRTTIVNTEGTVVAQNRKSFVVTMQATAKADDGTDCTLNESFFAYSADKLPNKAEMEEKARDLANRVMALSKAPVADAYAGPAILSGKAAAVLFHEVLGHRLEATRSEFINNNLAGFQDKQMTSSSIQLYMDPTLKTYKGRDLDGFYLYDDEGVKAQRVQCIENGCLKQYLTSRTPAGEFNTSNGHARAEAGKNPSPRQSNLIVETTEPYSEAELRGMLIAELKRQGKEYGYFFRNVNGGFTNRGSFRNTNLFNVNPTEVYKVFADGRKDQLVRGVTLIGTPLTVFTNIKAAGGESQVFSGYCGSVSGKVPVSGTSPYIYVSLIETQGKKEFNNTKNDIISSPKDEQPASAVTDGQLGDVIFSAMEDEMKHVYKELSEKQKTEPLLIDYVLCHSRYSQAVASAGACTGITNYGTANRVMADVILGDSMITSKIEIDNRQPTYIHQEMDYASIRKALRKESIRAYTSAVENLDNKKNKLNDSPKPEKEISVPEFRKLPPVVWIGRSAVNENTSIDTMKHLAERLSKVFLDYPELMNHKVYIRQRRFDHYRLTSEGQKIMIPESQLTIFADADIKTNNGLCITKEYRRHVSRIEDLPSEKDIADELRQFAESIIKESKAKVVKDLYIGPVLYEGEAAAEIIADNAIFYAHSYSYPERDMYDKKYLYLDKKIFPKQLDVYQFGEDSIYNGVNLMGYNPVDANGQKPMTLKFIEKGILKNMLSKRAPSVGSNLYTGNEWFNTVGVSILPKFSAGILHIKSDEAIKYSKLRKLLLKSAKDQGFEYAYIVRDSRTAPQELVRVNTKTGEEELILWEFEKPSRQEFKRAYGVSKEEIIYNKESEFGDKTLLAQFMGKKTFRKGNSIISPKAILLENVELQIIAPEAQKLDDFFYSLRH